MKPRRCVHEAQAAEIYVLRQQLASHKQALEMSHAVNVALLHKLGGQITFCQGHINRLAKEFPVISMAFDPDFITLKLNSEDPTPQIGLVP